MDQTPSKYVQSSRYTMEKSARKSAAIAGSGGSAKNFSLSANPKHYSHEEETQKIINKII